MRRVHVKTHKFFNQVSRQAMFEKVGGYVDKFYELELEIEKIKKKYNLEKIYRFDLGENFQGFSPKIKDYVQWMVKGDMLDRSLNSYPERSQSALKERLADKFQIPEKWIIIGAGLDSILDLISRVFLEYRDIFMMPIPSFYLFEEYSERMGAIPVFLELREEDNFGWTDEMTRKFKEMVSKFRPKIVWMANPNNPTGQYIEPAVLQDLISFARSYNTFFVADEAYGEYMDTPDRVVSAAQFIHKFENLMVLRTFSKKYGLAGIRVGYLMCSSQEIIEAILLHRHHFPVPQISVDIAQMAMEDNDFLVESQKETIENRERLCASLSRLKNFSFVPSYSSLLMIKNQRLPSSILMDFFQQRGIIASGLEISGLEGKNYLRITVGSEEANEYLCKICREIDIKSEDVGCEAEIALF